ncbi:hypothetical protein AMS68_007432 [Peltaster fructicola]|uniref:Carboxylic ester hydrolase n=1 Tax=Peltaster fructicola TaxID=286661 RepID=A0A6H0Y4R3_9PEZI|nr:hypothetical protein AMS68_007432 [Peltaster fructicola]
MGNVTSTPSAADQCTDLCSRLTFTSDLNVSNAQCQAYGANTAITAAPGQNPICGVNFTTSVPICRVELNVQTGPTGSTYMEVWLPNDNSSSWNGRTMNTDNGGLNGCVHYVDMEYVSGLGFAAIGDNAGHNSSSFDGSWTYGNNEAILDWTYRARHASVAVGKQVVNQFYNQSISKSYYIGCSTGGQQGMHSAQHYPEDFDGIIAGSSAADYNHLQDWSSRFVLLTGLIDTNDPKYLSLGNWLYVQSSILAQCDAAIDGVNDGILEDPTLCHFNSTGLACSVNETTNCLTDVQVETVNNVFTELYDTTGRLLYPSLLLGSEVDSFKLGQLSGTIQGIARDWFRGGVWNNTNWDPLSANQTDYAQADATDALHGNVSSFDGDLSQFRALGKKMIMYHGLADPLVSGTNSQRYYLKVAKTLGLDYTQMDPFMRLFRISGMAHCGVGGISGAGAWMFGQSLQASAGVDNVVNRLVAWVENGAAPDTLTGTKFWYDLPSLGVQFIRPHCRFPFRTTYLGGDSTQPSSWGCTFIQDWQDCGPGVSPRLCNADGSFT